MESKGRTELYGSPRSPKRTWAKKMGEARQLLSLSSIYCLMMAL